MPLMHSVALLLWSMIFIHVAHMSLTNSIAKCYHIVAANMYLQKEKKYRADYYTPIEKEMFHKIGTHMGSCIL